MALRISPTSKRDKERLRQIQLRREEEQGRIIRIISVLSLKASSYVMNITIRNSSKIILRYLVFTFLIFIHEICQICICQLSIDKTLAMKICCGRSTSYYAK